MPGPVGGTPTRREAVVAALLAATSGCQALRSDPTPSGSETRPDPPTDTASNNKTPPATETSTATPSPKLEDYKTSGIEFDRVVNVTTVGADPAGESDSSQAISDAATEGTLLVFPAGTYRVDSAIEIVADRVGLVGEGGVTIRPTSSVSGRYLVADGVDSFLFRKIDVDIRFKRQTGMWVHARTKFHVERVQYYGRGGLTGQAFNLGVMKREGTGRLRRVRVPRGGIPDRYDNRQGEAGNGRIGVWTGLAHRGTLRVVDCEFSEFGNNGMYTSRTPGDIQVENSYFENNNVCGVRISGAGSRVKNSEVVVNFDRYNGPDLTDTKTGFNPRGIMIDGGKRGANMPKQESGAEIRDTMVSILDTPEGGTVQSAIEQNPVARSLRVVDTDVQIDVEGTPAIRRPPPGSGGWVWRPGHKKPPEPYWTRLEDVTITGSSGSGPAIQLSEAGGSRIRNCKITQEGADRNGIHLENMVGTVIDGGVIRVGRYPLILQRTDEMDRTGCWLSFEDVPELTSTSVSTGGTKYARLQAGSDGCTLPDSDGQLSGDSWSIRLTATNDGVLVGTPPE